MWFQCKITYRPQDQQDDRRRSRKRTLQIDTEEMDQKDQQDKETVAATDEEPESTVRSSLVREKVKTKSKGRKQRKQAESAERSLPTSTVKLKRRKKRKISGSAASKLSSARLKSYGL